jgi:hypothetical protein
VALLGHGRRGLSGALAGRASRFVDAPQESVEAADKLVADVTQKLTAVFADQQTKLKAELDRSGKLSTEDLRLALRRYRTFFDRLLSI